MDIDVRDAMINRSNVWIFIDFDNVSWDNLAKIEGLPPSTNISLYVNDKNVGRLSCKDYTNFVDKCSANISQYVVPHGRNSVDFRIVYDVTQCLFEHRSDYVYILSGDKGYDGAIDEMQRTHSGEFMAVMRCVSLEEVLADYKVMQVMKCDEIKPFLDQIYGSYRSGFILQKMKELCSDEKSEE